jgi:multisubunit Na+/H+ antiporter MnhB subunit
MRYAHLSAGFMLTSIIGFFISVYFIMTLSMTWGFTFGLFFAIMFVASIISMTKAPYKDKEYQEELGIHEKVVKKNWRKKK